MWRDPDWVVVWRVQEACSLACRFCGYSRDVAWPRRTADADLVLAWGRVLGDVQRQLGQTVLVSWLGGEPLTWRELPRVSRVLAEEQGLQLGVTTNGLALASRRMRNFLRRHVTQVTVSIDGLADFHDSVRGQAGLFAELHESIARLRAEDPARRLLIRVNTVLMRGNVAAFAEFAENMAEWGIDELTFNQLGGNERPEFFPANRLLPEQVQQFRVELPELRRHLATRGLTLRGGEAYLRRIAASSLDVALAVDDCQPGAEFLFVDTLGRISPCSFTSDAYGVPTSEVQTVAQFQGLARRFAELRQSRRHPACADCHATHYFDKFRGHSDSLIPLHIGTP